jgi:hypothetical protein
LPGKWRQHRKSGRSWSFHGDADGVRLAHVAEMFRLKGGEIHGDLRPRSASRLAILPDTTHVTLMQRMPVIVPMVNDFLDAKP